MADDKMKQRWETAVYRFLDSKGSRNVDVFTAEPCILAFVTSELLRASNMADAMIGATRHEIADAILKQAE